MRGRPITIEALGPLREIPEAPRARARCPDYGESMFASLLPPSGKPSAQHRMSARAAEPIAAPRQEALPSATHTAAAIGNYEMPLANQRKLNICKFDGTSSTRSSEAGSLTEDSLHACREPHLSVVWVFVYRRPESRSLWPFNVRYCRALLSNRLTLNEFSSRDSNTPWIRCT